MTVPNSFLVDVFDEVIFHVFVFWCQLSQFKEPYRMTSIPCALFVFHFAIPLTLFFCLPACDPSRYPSPFSRPFLCHDRVYSVVTERVQYRKYNILSAKENRTSREQHTDGNCVIAVEVLCVVTSTEYSIVIGTESTAL